ncbi:hypothetical protein, partial [Bradyrhizobium sp. Mp64]|uniref:hypothetical protein n=1 Tax=Bradyrhizobium sp. Mp64 TaxID=3042158 RepID=UPI00248CB611
MSAPVRMEAPPWRCDRPAAAVHAALCPEFAPLIAAVGQHCRGARGARRASLCGRPALLRRRTATGLRRRARRLPDSGSRQSFAEGTSCVNALSEQILSELRRLLSEMSDG